MIRYAKARIYRKFIRFLCNWPNMVKEFYSAYRFVVVHFPFVRGSYKWKMITTPLIHFELNKNLYRRGRPCDNNALYEISWEKTVAVKGKEIEKDYSGYFDLDIVWNGVLIFGQVNKEGSKNVDLTINGQVLRNISIDDGGEFQVKITLSVLNLFPVIATISMVLSNNSSLNYGEKKSVDLHVPFGSNSLVSTLKDGYAMSKKGGIQNSSTAIKDRQEKYLELYSMVSEVFIEKIKTPLFLTYGTLLGFIRSGDFIKNDDDFDAGYISLKSTPEQVKAETLEIALLLLENGFNISINPIGRLFKIHKNTGVHLDLMPVWFEAEWNVAYGGVGVKITADDFLPAWEGKMHGMKVFTPKHSEYFLEGYYGKNWRIPDPGYVSDSGQTGKSFRNNYSRFLMTPYEYLKFKDKVTVIKKNNPSMGIFQASGLRVEI